MKVPVKCFECDAYTMQMDMSADHQHIACERCERIWCAVCVARIEVKISPEWQRRRQVAHLN